MEGLSYGRIADTWYRAILDLKNQRDKLHQYQRRIVVLTDRETQIAKQMLAQGDKKKALLALRRKKYQESLLAKTDSQLEQLEQLASSVEFAKIQKDVVFGLQQGTKVLQEIHAEMGGIEKVEKLMGDTADAIAYQKVIYQHLGFSLVCVDYVQLTGILYNRKLVRCSEGGFLTKTKKRSRRSLKHWRMKCEASSNKLACLPCPRFRLMICPRSMPCPLIRSLQRRELRNGSVKLCLLKQHQWHGKVALCL
jgi:hypothetical protein